MKFRDFTSSVKAPIERAHRRALDPSENVTPNNRYELSMGIESLDRGFEVPIESLVGHQSESVHQLVAFHSASNLS